MKQEKAPRKSSRPAVRDLKPALGELVYDLEWAPVARKYFDRSPSWIYNKLKCIDGNGGVGGFTDEEAEKLRGALCDMADRLRDAAAKI